MKRCPQCGREYDATMSFCLDDGSELLYGPGSVSTDEPQTAILHETAPPAEGQTRAQLHTTEQTAVLPTGIGDLPKAKAFDKRVLLASFVLAVAVVGGFFAYRYLAPASGRIDSIAVMPFVNESGNAEVEYLSDGLTETLIGSLTRVPDLNVKARSSVFRYKGRGADATTIGRELNVQAVLNGRVSKRGDQLILSLELVDAQTENAIWNQQYTRKEADLVSLQSAIARDVSAKLKSRLSNAEAAKVEQTYTADPEAYQLYLKGRFQWNKRTPESLKEAAAFYEQAIVEDPNYALAYSGLAETYVLFPNYSVAMPMDSMPKAKAAALRAIELDDSLAESHVALGTYYSLFAWNQPAAEREFRRAIELNPNYATAHQQFGIECLTASGRFDEAIAENRRAVELDPVSPIISADFGNVLFRARRYDEAITQLNRALTLEPNFWVTRWYLGQVYHAKAMYPEAVAEYRKALSSNENPWVKAQLVRSLAKSGDSGEARKMLAQLEADASRRVVSSASLALAYGGLDEFDRAFAMLDREIAERNSRPPVFAYNPLWDDFRDDPRFAALIQRVERSKLD